MSEQFDAYYKWLGIPPDEQPPTYYRLLGLRNFESDTDVIDTAAEQRMRHLRTYQTGARGEWKKDGHDLISPEPLPLGMSLDLRLEIFRRINEGGTPLSAQDIRLSYYSESPAVRYIQLAGIYDPNRSGAKRMVANCKDEFDWPWRADDTSAKLWKLWWNNTKTVTGQTSSEMFLWYLVGRCKEQIDRILSNKTHLTNNLSLTFRNRTDEVLDITCAQLKFEDQNPGKPRLLPTAEELATEYFPPFLAW